MDADKVREIALKVLKEALHSVRYTRRYHQDGDLDVEKLEKQVIESQRKLQEAKERFEKISEYEEGIVETIKSYGIEDVEAFLKGEG